MSEVINTYDQLMAAREHGLPDVGIIIRHWQGTREWYRNGWNVYRPGKLIKGSSKTNPFQPDYGKIPFEEEHGIPWREARKKALKAAMDFVRQRYGISEFARNPMGDYVDARVNKQFPLRSVKKKVTT